MCNLYRVKTNQESIRDIVASCRSGLIWSRRSKFIQTGPHQWFAMERMAGNLSG